MNRATSHRAMLLLGFAVASALAGDPPPAADIGQKLDQKVDSLNIKGMEIEAALADIGKQVGVEIVLDEQAAEHLPWGRQTKLSDVAIAHASLRTALPQILDDLAMAYEVRDGKIVVVPTPVLARLTHRPTWDELDLLRRLGRTDFTAEGFAALKLQYRITSKVDAQAMLQHQLERSGRGTIAQMLETATDALDWVWLVEQDNVIFRSKEAQINNRLSRQITARYANVPLSQILADLADKAGVTITFEPGMMLKLPPSTAQSYTLLLQSVSIRQALELVSAETGLKFETRANDVHISLSDALQDGGKTAIAARTSPVVAKLSVPSADGGYSLEFLVRADELPPDILEARGQMLQELIQKVRRDIAPAPPPTAQPAAPASH